MFPVPVPFPVPGDQRKHEEASNKIAALREQVVDLERRSERQALVLRALFLLFQEKEGINESQLLDQFRQLEISRTTTPTPPKMCRHCNRPVSLKHQRCLYCEAPYEAASVFELL